MKEADFSQLYFINKEIKFLQTRLKKLRNSLKSPSMQGVSRNDGVSNPVARTAELIEEQEIFIQENISKYVAEQNRLLRFIHSVEDSRIRQILTFRHVDGLNWVQVATRLGECSPDNVRMAYKRFMATLKQ